MPQAETVATAAESPSLPLKRPYSWKLVLLLWAMGIFGAIAVVPYVLELVSPSLKLQTAPTPIPREWLAALATIVQYSLYSFISAALGHLFARWTGLGAPILERLTRGEKVAARFRKIVPFSVGVGILGAFLIGALDAFVFAPALRAELGDALLNSISQNLRPNPFFGLLASFEGGIVEELMLRFFLFSLLAWLGSLLVHTSDRREITLRGNRAGERNLASRRPALLVLWSANILAALLFGLGHLPATATAGLPLTPVVIARALALNGALGLAYGYLYWTRGLESAMLAHFSTDVVLHFGFAFFS